MRKVTFRFLNLKSLPRNCERFFFEFIINNYSFSYNNVFKVYDKI